MKILIVEDEMLLAINLEMELKSLGYEVAGIAETAELAMQIMQSDTPDVVLMDVVIQGDVNGIELAGMIGRQYPTAKVVFMTAHSDMDTLEKIKGGNYHSIVGKPFDAAKLQESLGNN